MARTRARSCTGKKKCTQVEAWDLYYALRRKGAIGIHVYKCKKFCKKYHVGHLGRKRR